MIEANHASPQGMEGWYGCFQGQPLENQESLLY